VSVGRGQTNSRLEGDGDLPKSPTRYNWRKVLAALGSHSYSRTTAVEKRDVDIDVGRVHPHVGQLGK
jgi:hypothetical protein